MMINGKTGEILSDCNECANLCTKEKKCKSYECTPKYFRCYIYPDADYTESMFNKQSNLCINNNAKANRSKFANDKL